MRSFNSCLQKTRLAIGLIAALSASLADAQTPPRSSRNDEPDAPQVSDSGVGYIDTALICNRLRFRYDAAYDNVKPSRAEFFWPVGRPLGPGPGPETSVDYQDLSAYAEILAWPGLSLFGELPFRFVDPELQNNTSGLADFNVGFKLALWSDPCQITTFQLRTYVPSADGGRGLGTEHVSLEPAILWRRQLSTRWALEGEVRDWIAVDGTEDFAGNVLRYGIGVTYAFCPCWQGVTEVVGWTVLDGMTAFSPTPALRVVDDAAGDTIVNIKLGLRRRLTCATDLYAGYGQALTDETWYDRTLRVELRRCF